MISDLTPAVADAHRAELSRQGAAGRRARLATCCQPTAIRSRAARLLRGRLASRLPGRPVVCCA